MGSFPSKKKRHQSCEKDHCVRNLTGRIRILKEEIKEMTNEREKESRVYEREVMVFAFKEAEWKQERKRLREEVKRLKKSLEEKEEKIRVMEEDGVVVMGGGGGGEKSNSEKHWELLGTSFLIEQMREDSARRDEAVEKWKQLYLTIKTELDDLIQRTHGDGLYWRAEEEDMIQELKRELKEEQQNTEALQAQLASAEREVYRRERDIDMLRQSFRIISCKKKSSNIGKSFSKNLHL